VGVKLDNWPFEKFFLPLQAKWDTQVFADGAENILAQRTAEYFGSSAGLVVDLLRYVFHLNR
jgi:hypothetical protein